MPRIPPGSGDPPPFCLYPSLPEGGGVEAAIVAHAFQDGFSAPLEFNSCQKMMQRAWQAPGNSQAMHVNRPEEPTVLCRLNSSRPLLMAWYMASSIVSVGTALTLHVEANALQRNSASHSTEHSLYNTAKFSQSWTPYLVNLTIRIEMHTCKECEGLGVTQN